MGRGCMGVLPMMATSHWLSTPRASTRVNHHAPRTGVDSLAESRDRLVHPAAQRLEW
jgi:hypothetical protein